MLGYVPFDCQAVDRIRPVADDHFFAELFCCPHAIRHRVDERVDAAADVLQIDDKGIDVLDHILRRFARFAVERVNGLACAFVDSVRCLDHVVLHIAANPMLRAKERCQLKFAAFTKGVSRVDKCIRNDRGLITYKADAKPSNKADLVGKETFDTKDCSIHRDKTGTTKEHEMALKQSIQFGVLFVVTNRVNSKIARARRQGY